MKYLIAFITPHERTMAITITANNQVQAIQTFKNYNPCNEIIAITLLEDPTHQNEDKGENK